MSNVIATGVGATRYADTDKVTLDIQTPGRSIHIDLSADFAEALGLLLLNDPEHSDGYVEAEAAWGSPS